MRQKILNSKVKLEMIHSFRYNYLEWCQEAELWQADPLQLKIISLSKESMKAVS